MKCPECGSTNIFHEKGRYECFSCGHKWKKGEAKKPTIKELMMGRVLDGYIEARRVKPLTEFVGEEERRGFIIHGREYWLTKEELETEMGVPPEDVEKVWDAGKRVGEKTPVEEKIEKLRTKLEEPGTYIDNILGICRYTSFYITNELYGGYSASCEHGRSDSDYVNPQEVIKLAKQSEMPISLAGDRWKEIGRRGFGELVTPEEAKELVEQLKRLE